MPTPDVKPSETLAKAARYHAEHGHCKGSYRDAEGRVCVMGAIFSVTGARWINDMIPVVDYGAPGVAAADEAFKYVQVAAGESIISRVNDAPKTTSEDVTLLLKRASELAAKEGR